MNDLKLDKLFFRDYNLICSCGHKSQDHHRFKNTSCHVIGCECKQFKNKDYKPPDKNDDNIMWVPPPPVTW